MAEQVQITANGANIIAQIIEMGGHKPGSEKTLHEIADFMDTTWQKVNGGLIALTKHGLVTREEVEVTTQDDEGNDVVEVVKHIILSDDAIAGNYTVKEDAVKAE